MLGIIGGSGLGGISMLKEASQRVISTPYGMPSAPLTLGLLSGKMVAFMPRHGAGHTIAPHLINYRANLWALHAQGVGDVIAISTVGGISDGMISGALVVPDQIIDYTHGRESSFFDGTGRPLKHIDFTLPFCGKLRQRLLRAGTACKEDLRDGATYGATQGPRLETAAEINRMERDGAHIVGMTGMPEAVLARELGINYAMLAVVVNPAAGRGSNSEGVSIDEIHKVADAAMRKVCRVLESMEQA